jgi:hypothetical protein
MYRAARVQLDVRGEQAAAALLASLALEVGPGLGFG